MGLGSIFGTIAGGFIGGPAGAKIGGSLGGVFDSRSARRSDRKYDAGNIQRTVDQARKAGIHPLEVIRSGGLSGGRTAGRIQSPSLGESLDFAESVFPGDQKDQLLDQRLKESQIKLNEIEADTRARGRIGPSSTADGILGAPDEPDKGLNENTNYSDHGSNQFNPPWLSDAQNAEDFGGEISGLLHGVSNEATKYSYNKQLDRLAEKSDKSKAEIHQEIVALGAQGKAYYQKLTKELLFSDPKTSEERGKRIKNGSGGRINMTTGDIRRMRQPWEH